MKLADIPSMTKKNGRGTGHRMGAMHHRANHPTETVERARTLRERHGWTYSRIADELGVSMWTVADWCRYGTRYVS